MMIDADCNVPDYPYLCYSRVFVQLYESLWIRSRFGLESSIKLGLRSGLWSGIGLELRYT